MKHLFFLLSIFLLADAGLKAQDFEFGKITAEDVKLENTALDSNANAMVIQEFGTSFMRYEDQTGKLYIDFKYHVKIKIFNKNGFSSGNILIPRRIFEEDEEEVSNIQAVTVNFVNGQFSRHELDRKQIFNEKRNKYYMLTKFTLPNLTEGSIIEYSYTMRIPDVFNFKGWDFQSDIPKLHSEYIANIPALYNYNASLRGSRKLTSSEGKVYKDCFRLQGKLYPCSKLTYIMKNVPAFVEEDYMTAASNFKSAIYYELSDYIMLNGGKKSFTKTWKDVDYELVNHRAFGDQLKKRDLFKTLIPEIIKEQRDSLSQAKAIYAYIRKNIKPNGITGMFSENGIKKSLESHSGNTGDINLGLVSALSEAGFDTEPLILSTRANGTVNSLYPVITDFNYVVAKLNLNGNTYLLDATQNDLPFGLLPLHCINDKGRVINLKRPSYWYDLKASEKDMLVYNLNGSLGADGTLKAKLSVISNGYTALNKRNQIASYNSIEEYVEKLDEQMPGTLIKAHQIENLEEPDKTLTESYDLEMKIFDNMDAAKFFFNPFFVDHIGKNPFNLNERSYPVDFGAVRDLRMTARIELPGHLIVSEGPQNTTISLANGGGKYVFQQGTEGNILMYNQVLQLNKPMYLPHEYAALKELYSRIIQLQKTDLVFKKEN